MCMYVLYSAMCSPYFLDWKSRLTRSWLQPLMLILKLLNILPNTRRWNPKRHRSLRSLLINWTSVLRVQFLQLRLQATTCECGATSLINLLRISFSIRSWTIASIYTCFVFWGDRKKKRKRSKSAPKESKKDKKEEKQKGSGPWFNLVSWEPVVYSLTLGCTKLEPDRLGDVPKPETALDPSSMLETFLEEYRESLEALPKALFPQSEKHGIHSYTVQLGPIRFAFISRRHHLDCPAFLIRELTLRRAQGAIWSVSFLIRKAFLQPRHLANGARMEVLLRMKAFKPKAMMGGNQMNVKAFLGCNIILQKNTSVWFKLGGLLWNSAFTRANLSVFHLRIPWRNDMMGAWATAARMMGVEV